MAAMKPVSTSKQLPQAYSRVQWWHPTSQSWFIGEFCPQSGKYAPGYFWADGNEYHICNGRTYWMPEPSSPEGM